MSKVLYRSMLNKVKALLRIEVEHGKEDRALQQWQLLFTVDGIQYILGKGGVNTMFYQIGKAERVLCYPDELIALLESFAKLEYSSYAIYTHDGEKIKGGFLDVEKAKKRDAPIGSYIVGIHDGKKRRLFVRKKGLFQNNSWETFVAKAKVAT